MESGICAPGRHPRRSGKPGCRNIPGRPVEIVYETATAARIHVPAAAPPPRVLPVPAVAPARMPGSDPDSKVVPVAFVPKPGSHGKPDAERDERAGVPVGDPVHDDGIILLALDRVGVGCHDPDNLSRHVDLM